MAINAYSYANALLDDLEAFCKKHNAAIVAKPDTSFAVISSDDDSVFVDGVMLTCIAIVEGRRIYQPGRLKEATDGR